MRNCTMMQILPKKNQLPVEGHFDTYIHNWPLPFSQNYGLYYVVCPHGYDLFSRLDNAYYCLLFQKKKKKLTIILNDYLTPKGLKSCWFVSIRLYKTGKEVITRPYIMLFYS